MYSYVPKLGFLDENIINISNNKNFFLLLQEERKTTGRMIALVTALFLLSIAIYEAWIRKIAVVAGILVPAVIMILYAAWVVILTKRDNKKRALSSVIYVEFLTITSIFNFFYIFLSVKCR